MTNIKQLGLLLLITISVLFLTTTTHAETIVIGETSIVINGYVTTSQQDEKTLYVGGNITGIMVNENPIVTRNNLAEINLTDQLVTSWDPRPDGAVHDIIIYKDALIIAGQFKTINQLENKYIVTLNKISKEIVEPNITTNQPVYALARNGNMLYIGGAFTEINNEDRTYIASYNLEENNTSLWAPTLNDTVYEIFIYKNIIYIGGAFSLVDGQERNQLAALDLSDGSLLDWKPDTDLIITHIDEENGNLIVTGFALLGEEVIAKRLILDPVSGNTLSEEEINVDETVVPDLLQQEPIKNTTEGLMVDTEKLGFQIPSLGDLLTFTIRAFFVIAGLAALFFLLLGAFAWVTSGGDQDSINAARDKIQAAVVGLLMMVAVLAVVWTLEQVIFNRRICLGLSCPVTIPTLLQPSE